MPVKNENQSIFGRPCGHKFYFLSHPVSIYVICTVYMWMCLRWRGQGLLQWRYSSCERLTSSATVSVLVIQGHHVRWHLSCLRWQGVSTRSKRPNNDIGRRSLYWDALIANKNITMIVNVASCAMESLGLQWRLALCTSYVISRVNVWDARKDLHSKT